MVCGKNLFILSNYFYSSIISEYWHSDLSFLCHLLRHIFLEVDNKDGEALVEFLERGDMGIIKTGFNLKYYESF